MFSPKICQASLYKSLFKQSFNTKNSH